MNTRLFLASLDRHVADGRRCKPNRTRANGTVGIRTRLRERKESDTAKAVRTFRIRLEP